MSKDFGDYLEVKGLVHSRPLHLKTLGWQDPEPIQNKSKKYKFKRFLGKNKIRTENI
jgi:hypothetical protein